MDNQSRRDYWSHVPVWHIALFLGVIWWTIDIALTLGAWWVFTPHTFMALLGAAAVTTGCFAILSAILAISGYSLIRVAILPKPHHPPEE